MIQPGLARISQLLKNVEFPWRSIHVAGTNGKGSICHYASLLIKRKKVKFGKFTSPHLIDRWDCITVNNTPVDEMVFRRVEKHYQDLNLRDGIGASPFEILTASAFHIFNEEQIQIGIVEVGMGGKEDATNILNNQAVSVISRIDRDHQNFLGNTLEKIALHKAGILRPNVPYIINPRNEQNVIDVIKDYATTIDAGPHLSIKPPDFQRHLVKKLDWRNFIRDLTTTQADNALVAAVAAREAVRTIGLDFRPFDVGRILVKSRLEGNPGRMELVKVPLIFGDYKDRRGQRVLVDGAHNPNAATALREKVSLYHRRTKIDGQRPDDPAGWPVTWVIAMTEGKDAREYLKILLRPRDNVITTTFGPVDGMPWVKPMDPKYLLDIAKSVQPGVTGIAMPKEGALRALCTAKFVSRKRPVVLTGSLYLVGDLHRELRSRNSLHYWKDPEFEEDRKKFKAILKQEEYRVNRWLSANSEDSSSEIDETDQKENAQWNKQISDREKKRAMQEEMQTLDKELEALVAEEQRIGQQQTSDGEGSGESEGSENAAPADKPESPAEEQEQGAGKPGK